MCLRKFSGLDGELTLHAICDLMARGRGGSGSCGAAGVGLLPLSMEAGGMGGANLAGEGGGTWRGRVVKMSGCLLVASLLSSLVHL